jgi:hypothetical protein
VLEPYGYVVITGWRKSMDRTAAFYFDPGRLCGAHQPPQNVGVVGVAVFQEKPQPVVMYDYKQRRNASPAAEAPAHPDSRPIPSPLPARKEAALDSAAQSPPAEMRERDDLGASDSRIKDSPEGARRSLGKLGTGHGRSEDSRVTTVAFERATDSPAETLAIQYDRRENLAAMCVRLSPQRTR